MKNKKGQMAFVGIILVAFVAIVVGIALFQGAAQNIGSSTSLATLANQSISTVVNGTSQYLTNVKYITDVVIVNETGSMVINSANYTITNNVVYNGQEAVKITPNANPEVKTAWKVSGTAQPLGYIPESGGRGIAGIILIFAALAIAIVALEPTLRSGVLDMIGR